MPDQPADVRTCPDCEGTGCGVLTTGCQTCNGSGKVKITPYTTETKDDR